MSEPIRDYLDAHSFLNACKPHWYKFDIPGYSTPQECWRWMRGERTLFDEIIEWLNGGCLSGDAAYFRDDFNAKLQVALEREDDAVMFRLAWDDAAPTDRMAA